MHSICPLPVDLKFCLFAGERPLAESSGWAPIAFSMIQLCKGGSREQRAAANFHPFAAAAAPGARPGERCLCSLRTPPGPYHCLSKPDTPPHPPGPTSHHPEPKESADLRRCSYQPSTSGSAASNSVPEWWREGYKRRRWDPTGASPLTRAFSAQTTVRHTLPLSLRLPSAQHLLLWELQPTGKLWWRHWIPILAVPQNHLDGISPSSA